MARLPEGADLDVGNRVLYTGAVGLDYALRTGLATLGAGAALTGLLTGVPRADRRRLPFYAELAAGRDPEAVFAPPPPVDVRAEPGHALDLPDGRIDILRFDSPYRALLPELRDAYAAHANNGVARGQHWRHDSGPRPTLIVLHGFGASPAWLNVAFFSLREFFADGWDVLLYTLPFHGSRRGPRGAVNGLELIAYGMAHLNEALIQAVHDLRVFVDYLEGLGVPRIGATGLSLGGYVSAAAATVERRLDFVVPNAAVVWLPPLIEAWFPASLTLRAVWALERVDRTLLADALAVTSPISYAPVVPKDRLLVVAGLGDRLAPPEESLLLWEHWGRPRLEWFPGSHIVHFGRDRYLQAMRELMR